MDHEQREASPGRSPEQGGTSADELAYRLHQQELLASFGVLALRTPEFMDLLQEATRLCAEGLHIRYFKAMEYRADEDRFVVRAGVGWKPGVIGARTGADLKSPTGYAFRTGEPVISNHLEDEGRFRTPRILMDHEIRRAINVPIATETSRYGVLEADSPIEGRFTEADLAFMQGFANLLGVALERHRSEDRLRLAHERNEEILESISDAFYAVDRDWRFTYVNRKAEEWWQRKREDLIGKVYWDEFPAAVGSEAYQSHQLARRERRTVHIETVSPLLGHWVDIDIHPTTAGGLAVYFRDISARKRGEAALRETEERYRLAARATNDAIWDWDLMANRIVWNEALTTLFGYTDTKTTGTWWKDHIHPDDRERVVESIQTVIAGDHEHWSAEYRFLRADGSEAYVFDRGFVTRDDQGKAARMIGAMLDLTERKRAEAALRASEEFTRSILKSSTDCIKVLDTDAHLRFMSPGGLDVMEVDDFGAIEGCDWRDFWSGPDHEKAREAVRTALAGGNARFQGHTPTMKGKPRWWDVAVTPIPAHDGSVEKLLSVSRDITETKQAEEHQLLLIHELNHRVKNTLATVQSIASQTLRNAATLDEAQGAFEARLFALSRAHDVLTRENWEGASLRAIISEAIAPYSNAREDRLHLRGPDVRLTPRMALALAMALQELSTNAVKHGALSNEVGEIRISWGLDATQAPPHLHLRWEESGGPPVQAPKRRGFGTRLIERSLALDLEGDVEIRFAPGGVICTVDTPLEPAEQSSAGSAAGG
jgi:PAS domain S-box-containing protein